MHCRDVTLSSTGSRNIANRIRVHALIRQMAAAKVTRGYPNRTTRCQTSSNKKPVLTQQKFTFEEGKLMVTAKSTGGPPEEEEDK